jgi:hypothetical protein
VAGCTLAHRRRKGGELGLKRRVRSRASADCMTCKCAHAACLNT